MVGFRAVCRIGPLPVALALVALGCEHKLEPAGPVPAGAAAPDAGAGSSGGPPSLVLPDGGAGDGGLVPVPPAAGGECVAEAITGEMVPLDLQLVLDASGSMRVVVGGQSRWRQVAGALETFVRDPRSAGLGVGLQVFPFTIVHKPCVTDADCPSAGGSTPGMNYWCTRPFACGGAGVDPATARACDPNDAYCPQAGTRCVMAGRCSRTGGPCHALGQPCAGGMAGDVCGQAPTVCKMAIDSCEPGDYQTPRVPIVAVPAEAGQLMQRLAAVQPGGNTPLGPAVAGAARYLREYLAAHPGHRGALVLGTDVVPSGCTGDDVEAVAAVIEAARLASPSISTYVIGTVAPGDTIRQAGAARLAQAGGTGAPFVLNESAPDLGSKFLEALSRIRGGALACEFRIPTPSVGVVDYGRVNIRFTGASSVAEALGYVGSAAGCVAGKDGWYYDVDPGQGQPTTVKVCETTCERFKAEAAGAVELLFGCRTRVD